MKQERKQYLPRIKLHQALLKLWKQNSKQFLTNTGIFTCNDYSI